MNQNTQRALLTHLADQSHAAIDDKLDRIELMVGDMLQVHPDDLPATVRAASDLQITVLCLLASEALATAYQRKFNRDTEAP